MNSLSTEFATILNQAGSSSRHDAKSMATALQQAETTARREKLAIPILELAGEWRLCFATGASKSKQKLGIKLGKGYYLPKFVLASIAFTPDLESTTSGTIANQLQVGGLGIKFTGYYRYPGKKNLLIFDFNQIQINLFGRMAYQGEIRGGKTKDIQDVVKKSTAKMPFFAFFWASTTGIAARGRGGGLALWVRDKAEVV